MKTAARRSLPIRIMREDAGLSIEQAAEKIGAKLGRVIKPEYLRLLEYRGVGTYDMIEAAAAVYEKKITDVAAAFKSGK